MEFVRVEPVPRTRFSKFPRTDRACVGLTSGHDIFLRLFSNNFITGPKPVGRGEEKKKKEKTAECTSSRRQARFLKKPVLLYATDARIILKFDISNCSFPIDLLRPVTKEVCTSPPLKSISRHRVS